MGLAAAALSTREQHIPAGQARIANVGAKRKRVIGVALPLPSPSIVSRSTKMIDFVQSAK